VLPYGSFGVMHGYTKMARGSSCTRDIITSERPVRGQVVLVVV
jgi:hypothetical protein